jgi:RNA polymerase sigma factor (sigma-70 family)
VIPVSENPPVDQQTRTDVRDGNVRRIDITPAVQYLRLEDACSAEFPRLVRFLTLYCGDRETALDLAQETCARGCAQWSSVRRMQDQRAWFTKVALNLARSRWRRQAVERRVLALIGSRPAAAAQQDIAESVTVRAAVARLTPRQRAAVVLRYLGDLDLATTATALRCSEGTVKKLTARGLATLKTLLEFDLDAGGGHV